MKFIDLDRQYQRIKTRVDENIAKVISGSAYIMGSEVRELEQKLAGFTGCRHAIACSSGTDALLLAMMALDVKPGDEIITSVFSFIAAAEMIAFLKAKPVFVDIDPETFNIDPTQIAQMISSKTKGIIPVDMFGQCADYDSIQEIAKAHKLFIIEDAAQSFGAEYHGTKSCSLGDIGCTSFFPAKPLGCFGDGGMVFTNRDDLADRMRSMSLHGQGSEKYDHVHVGINGRLDTIQAAVLLAKFEVYPDEIRLRQEKANYYTESLKDTVKTPKINETVSSVYAQYSILTDQREGLTASLKAKQIPTAVHYPKALHQQSVFKNLGYKPGDFPVAEEICRKILSLPMHPYLTKEEQDEVIGVIIVV